LHAKKNGGKRVQPIQTDHGSCSWCKFFCWDNIQLFWNWRWNCICATDGCCNWPVHEACSHYIAVHTDVCSCLWHDSAFTSWASQLLRGRDALNWIVCRRNGRKQIVYSSK